MTTLLQPGDRFRISTRRMAASGTVTKVNRATVGWQSDYQPAPNGPIFNLTGKIALCEFHRATIMRPSNQTAFSIL